MASCNKQSNLVGKGDSSPLSTKLQEAWLQSQLLKVQKSDPSSFSFSTRRRTQYQIDTEPLAHKSTFSHLLKKPSLSPLYSYSTKESSHGLLLPGAPTNMGVMECDGESDTSIITFVNDMLMEKDIDYEVCMRTESNMCLAMEKGFIDLLHDSLPPTERSNNFENMVQVGGVIDYSNNQLDITQLLEELFEDRLIQEYTKMYQNVSQLNHCNISDIAMDKHSQSMDSTNCASNFATSSRLDEHSNTRVAMCLQCGGDERVQHNGNFAFEFGDEDHLSDLLLK
jgi:hypothetical protein